MSLIAPDAAPEAVPPIRALDANRAALSCFLVQSLGAPLLAQVLGIGVGLALVLTTSLNVALLASAFRRPALALLRDPRWRRPPPLGITLGAFVLVFFASRAFSGALTFLMPGAVSATPELLEQAHDQGWMLLAGGLLVPVIEEVAFRGLMLRGHERAAEPLAAAISTSFIFGLAHGAPVSVVGIIPLAYGMARLVQYTGSFWSGVVVHALNNSLALGLAYVLLSRNKDIFHEATKANAQLQDSAMAPLMGLGLLLIGVGLLAVTHLWLRPQPDAQDRAQPGPILSLSYLTIGLIGLLSLLGTLPAVQPLFTRLHDIIQ